MLNRSLTEHPDIQPVMLDVSQVAILLGCSARHVRRLTDAGKCPRPIKLGALARWPRPVIDDWIASDCPSVRTARKGGAK
jgi:predicted DNA-binding transcriptional regulator AlpA